MTMKHKPKSYIERAVKRCQGAVDTWDSTKTKGRENLIATFEHELNGLLDEVEKCIGEKESEEFNYCDNPNGCRNELRNEFKSHIKKLRGEND